MGVRSNRQLTLVFQRRISWNLETTTLSWQAPYKLQHRNFNRHTLGLQSREWFWLQLHHSSFSYFFLAPNHNGTMILQQLPDLRTHPMRNGESKNDRREIGSTKAKSTWRPALHGWTFAMVPRSRFRGLPNLKLCHPTEQSYRVESLQPPCQTLRLVSKYSHQRWMWSISELLLVSRWAETVKPTSASSKEKLRSVVLTARTHHNLFARAVPYVPAQKPNLSIRWRMQPCATKRRGRSHLEYCKQRAS